MFAKCLIAALLASGWMAPVAAPQADQPASPPVAAGQLVAPATQSCELHVNGTGRPNFVPKNPYMQEYRRREKEAPLSPENLYNNVYRANTLDEALLRQLIPDRNVVVVRHSAMHDIDSMPLGKIKGPLHPSGASCYADLLIDEVVQIIWPGKWTGAGPDGVAGEALARSIVGGSKLTIGYWFQVRRTPNEPMKVFRGKFSGRLPNGFPIATNGIEDKSGIVERAANESLRLFVQKVTSTP